jgi:predicted nucleic acid-binding protein
MAERQLLGNRFGTCFPVLCEVQAGAGNVVYPVAYQRKLRSLMRQDRIWPMDWQTTLIYSEIHRELKGAGRMISIADRIVAALARQMSLIVLTTDRDFELLPDIKTENWTS